MAYNKEYYEAHKQEIARNNKKWRESNKGYVAEYFRKRYAEDEAFREAHKERSKQWARENKEKVRERQKEWYYNNPDKVKEYRIKGAEKRREWSRNHYNKKAEENHLARKVKNFRWPDTLFDKVFGDPSFQYDPDALLGLLPERNRDIMYKRFHDKKTLEEIAREYRVSEQMISSICLRCIKRLGKYFKSLDQEKGRGKQ